MRIRTIRFAAFALALALLPFSSLRSADQASAATYNNPTFHRTWQITGLEVWDLGTYGIEAEKKTIPLVGTLSLVEEKTAYHMLGLNLYHVDGRPNVLRVNSMYDNSPGHRAGIKVNDILTAYNGTPFTFGTLDWEHDRFETSQKWRMVNNVLTARGDTDLTFSVERDGETRDMTIKRDWIEAERLSLRFNENWKSLEDTAIVTIRVSPENIRGLSSREEILQEWKEHNRILMAWDVRPSWPRGHLVTKDGEIIDVENIFFFVNATAGGARSNFLHTDILSVLNKIAHAKQTVSLALRIYGVDTHSGQPHQALLKKSAETNVPPPVNNLFIHAVLIDIQTDDF